MLIYWVKAFTPQGKTQKPYWSIVGEIGLGVYAEKTKYMYVHVS